MYTHSKPNGVKPTHLMYKANMSHAQMQQYLVDLEENGFMQRVEEKSGQRILITEKGILYLQKIIEMKTFEEAFGL